MIVWRDGLCCRRRCLAVLYSLALHGALAGLLLLTVSGGRHLAPKAPSVITVSLRAPEPRGGYAYLRSPAAVDSATSVRSTPQVNTSRTLTVDRVSLPSLPHLAVLSLAKSLSAPHAQTRFQLLPQMVSGQSGTRTSSQEFNDPYKALLERKLRADLHYPWSAREEGQQGTTLIRVRISRNGIIEGVTLVHSFGSTVLDDEARRVFGRIGRLPALPKDFLPDTLTLEFVVPIHFQLVGRS